MSRSKSAKFRAPFGYAAPMKTPAPRIVARSAARVLDVLGTRNIIRISGDDSNQRILFLEVEFPAAAGIPLHVHSREDEVFHVLSGTVEFTLDGRTTPAGHGVTVYGPRDVPHAYRAAADGPARMLISVVPAGLETMFMKLAALPAGPPDMARVAEIVGGYGIRFV